MTLFVLSRDPLVISQRNRQSNWKAVNSTDKFTRQKYILLFRRSMNS